MCEDQNAASQTTAGGTLKPCPFCGGDAAMRYDGPTREQIKNAIAWAQDYDGSYYVECEACQATGPSISGIEEAAEAWDRRTANG